MTTFVTARLASKLGAAALKKQLGWSSSEPDAAGAEARAAETVAQMGKLKGLVMKRSAQMASYLPDPCRRRLAGARAAAGLDRAHGARGRRAHRRGEVGGSPASRFDAFDDHTPFAAA